MSPRFMMPLAVAAGTGMLLFGIGIVFGLGLLAPPQKIQANGPSKYGQLTRGASDQVKRFEDDRALAPIYQASHGGAVATEAASAKAAVPLGEPQVEKRAKPPAAAHRQRTKRAQTMVRPPAGIERTDPDPFIRQQLLRSGDSSGSGS